eukprot:COSAG01_NODE_10597_length_2125_cov_1.130800_2_plen_76_part_00
MPAPCRMKMADTANRLSASRTSILKKAAVCFAEASMPSLRRVRCSSGSSTVPSPACIAFEPMPRTEYGMNTLSTE